MGRRFRRDGDSPSAAPQCGGWLGAFFFLFLLLSSFFFLFSTILFSFSLIYLVFILRDHNLKSRTAQRCQVFMGFQWGQNVFLKKKQKRIHHVFIRFFFVSMITLKKTNKQKKNELFCGRRPISKMAPDVRGTWKKKTRYVEKKTGNVTICRDST